MKKIIALILLLAICSPSYADKPKKKRDRREATSEDKQRRFARVWLIGIVVIAGVAIQEGR